MFKWISFFIFLLFLGGCTNEPPVIKLELLEVTFERVEFDLDVLDENELGYIDSILLLKDNSIVERKDELDGYFGNLLSDTNYSIQVIYKYQFRTNQDIQTKTDTIQFKTLSYSKPSVEIQLLELGHHSFSFDINLVDPYEFIIIDEVKIIDQNGLEMIINNSDSVFVEELYSDHEYRIKVAYSFDLNDGIGLQEKEHEKTIFTEAYTTPGLDLIINSTGKHNVNFDIDFLDPDLKGKITSILLQPGSINLTSLDQLEGLIFDELLANSEYIINVTMQYDLVDGNGLITREATVDFNTEAYTTPNLRLEITDLSNTELNFDITKIDPDNRLNSINIQVTSGSSILFEIDGIETLTFNQLRPNTNYQLKVNYSYDLLDGSNESNESISISFKTLIHKGEGTIDEPYIIESPIDFQNINVYGNEKELYFVLNNDIDFDGFELKPINYFSHHLDGKGYRLAKLNFVIENEDTNSSFGIFRVNVGTIKNLTISELKISILNDQLNIIGGLVGSNHGLIENVNLSFIITIISMESLKIGGVSGINGNNARLINSRIGGEISVDHNGILFLGGFTGHNYPNGILSKLNSNDLKIRSTATSSSRVGGIAGTNEGIIELSKSISDILSLDFSEVHVGGIVGSMERRGNIINNYSNSNVVAESTGGRYSNVGGIVGFAVVNNSPTIYIQNNYSTGYVEAKGTYRGNAGGIIGYNYGLWNSTIRVERNLSSVKSHSNADGAFHSGGIVGQSRTETGGIIIYNNNYIEQNLEILHRNSPRINWYDENIPGINLIEINYINDPNWFREYLNWDEDIWDLTRLDLLIHQE